MRKLFLFLSFLSFLISCKNSPEADQIIIGKIWTANPDQPWTEAMAISGDTILATGTAEEIEKYRGEKTIIQQTDTNQLIVPGFIESHTHFVPGGLQIASVKLRQAKSPAEFIQTIAAYAKTIPAGTWITGGEWDHQLWGGQLPERSWIDSVTREHPVLVVRTDGHMALANSRAMELAGITENTPAVDGGEMVRKNNKLTGLFKDNALYLLVKAQGTVAPDRLDEGLKQAMNYIASNGITSIHSLPDPDMINYIDVFRRAKKNGTLITRIYAAANLEKWPMLQQMVKDSGIGDRWVRIGLLKGFTDGSLGSHTAAFFKPFNDTPKDSGFFVNNMDSMYTWIKAADAAGLQIAIHAIGDRSIDKLLDVFERVEKENGPRDRRFRMEHAQHIAPFSLGRFAKLKVIASVQPYHAIDDGRWAEKVIGHERSKTTYAFRSLIDSGATLAFGSDWYVAPASPLWGVYAAVTRRTLDDKNPGGWIPEQKISVEEAMKAYTINAAYASFEEDIKGSLQKGKLADYTVLGKNIFEIDPVTIKDTEIIKTVVGGKIVYEK